MPLAERTIAADRGSLRDPGCGRLPARWWHRWASGGRQFWIRTAAVLMIGLAVLAVIWLGLEGMRAFRQRQSVFEIWKLGGYVHRLHQLSHQDRVGPRWFNQLLGEDFLDPVVVVNLAASEATDDDLARVGKLKQQFVLDLRETRISGAGLRHLSGLAVLRMLRLTGTAISDAGLTQLTELTRLELLYLDQTSISDAGLKGLSRLPNLRRLDLSETRISDAGLEYLKQCHRLEVLVVHRCDVSDAAVRELEHALPGLRVFDERTRRPSLEGTN